MGFPRKKNKKQTGGMGVEDIFDFFDTPLEFLDFLLYPW